MLQWLQGLRQLATRSLSVGQLREFIYGPRTIAGVAISEEIALGISAFYRAVHLKSSTVAGLPVEVFRDTPGKGHEGLPRHPVSQLLADPNDDQNALKFWTAVLLHVCCAGKAFAEIERDTDDRPIGLHLIHWRNVRVLRLPNGLLTYQLIREGKEVPARDMLHVIELSWDGLDGISPVRASRETLGISVAADRHAGSVFGSGAVPRGVLKVNAPPSPELKAALRETWETIHGGPENSNKVGLLFAGSEWVETNMSPEDAQLLQSRAFQISEVSRITGVPPNLLFSGEQSSYNSDEEANLAFYDFGLRSLIDKLQAELAFKLLTREERFAGYSIRYKVESKFPRITSAKANTWKGLVLSGLATPNEGRAALGLNPMEAADQLLIPVNLQILSDHEGNEKVTAKYGGDTKPAAATGADQAGTDDVASTALNGAQITSLLELVNGVAAGTMPVETAKGIIAASFPTLSADEVDAILNPLAGFNPAALPPPAKAA